METNTSHITNYRTLALVLITLLACTVATILLASVNLAVWNVVVVLIIAGVKGFFVLTFFMHLKYENLLLRIFVGMVFLLFVLIVVITFFDYMYR
jgi:cytochrome c oxidase subunit IV